MKLSVCSGGTVRQVTFHPFFAGTKAQWLEITDVFESIGAIRTNGMRVTISEGQGTLAGVAVAPDAAYDPFLNEVAWAVRNGREVLDGRRIIVAEGDVRSAVDQAERTSAPARDYDRTEVIVFIPAGSYALTNWNTVTLDNRGVNLYLVGSGADRTTLRGGGTFVEATHSGVSIRGLTFRGWRTILGSFNTSDSDSAQFTTVTYHAPFWHLSHSAFTDVVSLIPWTKAGILTQSSKPVRIKPDGVTHIALAHTRHEGVGNSSDRAYIYYLAEFRTFVLRDSTFRNMRTGVVRLGNNIRGKLGIRNSNNFFVDQWGVAYISGNVLEDMSWDKGDVYPISTHYTSGLVLRNNLLQNYDTTKEAEPIYVKSKFFVVDRNTLIDMPYNVDTYDGSISAKFGYGSVTNNEMRQVSHPNASLALYFNTTIKEVYGNRAQKYDQCAYTVRNINRLQEKLDGFSAGSYRYYYGPIFGEVEANKGWDHLDLRCDR
jgi:hypothetical protein